MSDETTADRVNTDIDLRMIELFDFFEHFEDSVDRDIAIRIARAAYYLGYYDAFKEARPGSLFFDNGYGIPERSLA